MYPCMRHGNSFCAVLHTSLLDHSTPHFPFFTSITKTTIYFYEQLLTARCKVYHLKTSLAFLESETFPRPTYLSGLSAFWYLNSNKMSC